MMTTIAEKMFDDLAGYADGSHWGLTDIYPPHEAVLRYVLEQGWPDFDTGWWASKKEVCSARITREGREITCEAMVSDDFDTPGQGEVVVSDEGEAMPALYDKIMEGLDAALAHAEEDLKCNQEYHGFSIQVDTF